MLKNVIAFAQLGCGYWGPNLLRNFSAQPGCHVKWVADNQSPERRAMGITVEPRWGFMPNYLWDTNVWVA